MNQITSLFGTHAQYAAPCTSRVQPERQQCYGSTYYALAPADHSTIQVFRNEVEQDRKNIYESSMDGLISHYRLPPELTKGDVVQAKLIQRERFGWRDGLNLAATVTGLAWGISRTVQRLR